MALLRRRQHAGRDRAQARHFAPGGAAPRFAGDQRAAHQGQARPSDRALHGARRRAEAAVRPALLRDRADRSGLDVLDARHRPSRGGRNRALAAQRRSRPSSASARGARCAPSPTNCRRWNARSTSSWRWSAPPRPTARLRSTTSSFAFPTRVRAPHYPMPLPVIARSVEERELLTSLASVQQPVRPRRAHRRQFRRRRRRSAIPRRWCRTASSRARRPKRCARPARSAKSPAGRSTRRGQVLTEGIKPARRQRALATGGQPAGDRRRDGAVAARAACAARSPGGLISGLVTDEATAEHLLQR